MWTPVIVIQTYFYMIPTFQTAGIFLEAAQQLVPAGNEKTSGEKLAEQIFQAMVGDWLGTSIGTWDISLWWKWRGSIVAILSTNFESKIYRNIKISLWNLGFVLDLFNLISKKTEY